MLDKSPYMQIFFALQTAFLAILVPLSLSLSKSLILDIGYNKGKLQKEEKEIINFWFFSDFLMSATAIFGGYALVLGFSILFEISCIEVVYRFTSTLYWLAIFHSLWKVLEKRVFTNNKKEQWELGGIFTVLYLIIWNIFFIIVYFNMIMGNYFMVLFWLSIKSVLMFIFWYIGGILYLPLTNLYRLKTNK